MSRELFDEYLEKAIFGLVLALVIFAPLATGAVRATDFAGVQVLAVALLVLWLIRIWVRKGHRMLWAPVCWVAAGFLIYAVVRYFTAPVEYLAREQLLRVLVYGVVFFAILDNLNRQEYAQGFGIAMVFVAMGLSAYAIYQLARNSPYVWNLIKPAQYMHRGSGTFICPNHLAGFLEMILPVGLAFALAGRFDYTLKVVLGYACLAILAGIGATVSRGGWFSAGVALAVFFLVLLRYPETRLSAAVVLALLIAAGLFVVKNIYRPVPRFQKAFTEVGTIDEIRFQLVRPTLEVWTHHFWVGGGPGHFDFYFRQFRPATIQLRPQYAHNDYLNTLADWGTVGGIFLAAGIVLIYAGFFQSWKFVRRTNDLGSRLSNRTAFVLGCSIGLLAILIHSALDFNLQIPGNALLAVALAGFGSGYLRYGTERFWVSQRWLGKTALTILILAAIGYLAYQSGIRYREGKLLGFLEDHPDLTSPETMAVLKRAHEIEPKNFDTVYKMGELLRVDSWNARYGGLMAFPEYKDYQHSAEEAMKWFQLGMQLNPLEPQDYIRYGLCLDWLDRINEATSYFRKALELDPNNYYVLALAGWHFIQAKDYRLAKGLLVRSSRFEWKNPLAVSYMTLLKIRMGREEKGQE